MTCMRCQGCMAKDHFMVCWRVLKTCGWTAGAVWTADMSMIPSWREIGSDRGWLQLSQRGGRLDKIGLGSKKRAMSSQV